MISSCAASMQYSAFTSVLNILVKTSDKDFTRHIPGLLRSVLVENSILHNSPASFASLISSLKSSEPESLRKQLEFLDNCICRIAKKPVHYQDMVVSLAENATRPVSLLVAAIPEQWPFVVRNGDAAAETAVATWTAKLLGELKHAGEDTAALRAARDKMVESTENKKAKSPLKKALKGVEDVEMGDVNDYQNAATNQKTVPTTDAKEEPVDLIQIFGPLPTEGNSHPELHRWEKEELEVAVEQGRISELVLCLCSEYEEVRRQAFMNMSRFMTRLKVRWHLSLTRSRLS